MIDFKGIHKTYPGEVPLHVLKGVDLHIDEGELVSIMGPSGSGKSTMLNIMGILDDYDEGEYRLAGRLVKNLNEKTEALYRNELIGFIFQSFNLEVSVSVLPLPVHSSRIRRLSWPMSQQERLTARQLRR